MLHKTEMINTRIEPGLKRDAEIILRDVGLTSAEAIRIFYKQVCLHNGLPFSVNIPNDETLAAMRDVEAGNTFKANSIEEMFAELDLDAED